MDAGTAAGGGIIERLGLSGLRGRGGGWFPAARKWRAVQVEGGEPLVIANGAEGEPGSVKDRWLMRTRPEAVWRGLVTAARALSAREGLVYLKGSFAAEEAALVAALGRVEHEGLALRVHRGADTYVAGEETAVIEALEQRKAWPRAKPPLPAAVGFAGRPTLVQNVETLARVPEAVADPAAYAAGERTLVTLWGHVARPGVHEVPLGTPLRAVIEGPGGGAPAGISLVFPAGPNAVPLTPDQLDTPLHPDALRERGSALGTAAVLVLPEGDCPVSLALAAAAFFERDSCGQCPPCVVGAGRLAVLVRGFETGGARGRDLPDLKDAAGFMAMHGYCAHSRTGAAVVTGIMARFPEAVQRHFEAAGCPAPEGRRDPFAPGAPERAAIEAWLEEATRPAPAG